ncbi:MAG: 1-acyl-sn-glycerol-3-phosphate acyltransferase, partial [Gammaproteobacteria bacterium]|nr:1-acyl-sn-glycerol-3-phosphate acyltransferase [Gammaproteobacteria bacterium]
YYKIYNLPILNFVFRTAGAIPIAGKHENPELMEQAFSRIEQALNKGELVCIFPEGKLTRNGKMNKFRPGVEWVLETSPVPVIPMALNGLWGSAFSRHPSNIILRILKGIRSSVNLTIAPSLKAGSAQELQKQVEQIVTE